MKRLTRRLHTPRPSEDEDDPASLPIQRVPSTRRRSIRPSPSYRSSRRISTRHSTQRLSAARISRAASAAGASGFMPGSQSSSVLLGAIGAAALEDNSSYSTESELEEQPITMRSPRLERARATALAATSQPVQSMREISNRDSVAELIKQITGRLEDGRCSRDTMSSAWEFSLNDYCAAFPTPPTPGIAPRAPWATTNDNPVEEYNLSSSPTVTTMNLPPVAPLSRPPALRTPLSNPTLGASNTELKAELTLRTSASWDNWSTWPSPAPVKQKAPSTRVVTRPNTCESQVVVTHVEKHRSISTHSQLDEQLSIMSSEPSSPPSPETPPFARPRSVDPLSQARRKTRIVCGQVIDGLDDDEEFADELADGPVEYFAPIQDDDGASNRRRVSNKSSLRSSSTHPRLHTHALSTSTISNQNAYSLNSPSDDEEPTNVGVALTTEYRELATPSPVLFAEQEDMRLTLYARRKGRMPEFATPPPLRVKPPPLLSPAPTTPSSTVSSAKSPANSSSAGGSTFEGGVITPNLQNEFATGRAISPQVPKTAPSKRKSFFRYPFGSKRSAGSLKLAQRPTNGQGAPPLASPRAKEPPMSAAVNKQGFSPKETAFGGRQPIVSTAAAPPPSSYPIRYLNQTSKFISFSRPSSSRGKAAVAPA